MNASKFNTLLFSFIVLVSLYLRLPGIHNGLPFVLNPGESDNLLNIFSLGKNFLKFDSLGAPPLFLYINSIFVFIKSGGFDVNSFFNVLEVNPGGFYIPLRVLSVLFGVGSVIVLYFIGLIFSHLAGIFAAGFLAVSMLHVKFSQLFLPFSAMVFFSLLSLLFTLRAFKDKYCNLLPATLFALCSTSMNYIGIVSIVPILVVLFIRKELSKFKTLLGIFFISFTLVNLQVLINSFGLVKSLISSYVNGYHDYHYSSYNFYLFDFLLTALGPGVWFCALFLIKYKKEYDLNLLKITFSVPFVYFGLVGFLHLTKAGYALLLVPYVSLASAMVFSVLYDRRDTVTKNFFFIVLALFAFYVPLKYTFKYNKVMGLPDTRIIATEWINDNASGDVKIVSDKNSIQTHWFYPYDKRKLRLLGIDPDIISDRQEFKVTSKLLQRKDWFKALRKKIDYVVISSLDYEKILREPGYKLEKKYYRKLLRLKPIITINPYLLELEKQQGSQLIEELYSPFLTLWQRERAGPLIKIYKL